MKKQLLTKRQSDLLQLLGSWTGPDLPRLTVIARELGLNNESSVRVHLGPLVEAGLVERLATAPGEVRLPRLTERGRAHLGLIETSPQVRPLRSGVQLAPVQKFPIPCGEMQTGCEEPDYVENFADLFESFRPGDYLLVAEGNSMVSPDPAIDSIYPGDRCLVRPEMAPCNGEVIHAEYELPNGQRERTLKQFFLNPHTGEVTLKAWNPVFPEIRRDGEKVIAHGVVLEVLRRLRNRK